MLIIAAVGCADEVKDPLDSTSETTEPSTTTPTTVPPLEQEGHVVPGPLEDGFDASLADLVDGHDRVFGALGSGPTGLALTAELADPDDLADWVATGSGHSEADLQAQLGVPVESLVVEWTDVGHQGLVGGVGALADAHRYAVLRDDPDTTPGDLDAARASVERVLETLHLMHEVTGRSGTLARGIAPVDLAGLDDVDIVPLFDDGDPQPRDKEPTWRADESGRHPDLIWIDDAGKDQWVGYVLALGAAWNVAHDDPSIAASLVSAIEDDARELGLALMDPSPYTGVDLTIIDADGRHATLQDLNATQADGVDLGRVGNPYNALLSLAIVRTLAEVSGDATLGSFFDELALQRGYSDELVELGSSVYYGYSTDYSEVVVAYAALLSWLTHEADPTMQEIARIGLSRLWAPSTARSTADHLDPFAAIVTAAWVPVDDADLAASLAQLPRFGVAPLLDGEVVNCDDAELASDTCVAVDGSTPVDLYGFWDGDEFVPEPAYGGVTVAVSALPQHLRPPTRVAWSADPYRVNGGGSGRMFSSSDLRAAYWLGRSLGRAR